MSKRRNVERHLRSYGEIHEIMSAMKNLAMMETLKLTRFINHQQRVVTSMETVARDFLAFHGHLMIDNNLRHNVYLVIGTERGFCGDVNETLITALEAVMSTHGPGAVIVIGSRASARLPDDSRVVARLSGATVVEEVEAVLLRLIGSLRELRGPLRFTVLHHRVEEKHVTVSQLNPFRDVDLTEVARAYPPKLNLDPMHFLEQFADQYLLAALQELFYSALLAENQHRMQHMEGAVRRLEQRAARLVIDRNRLRQEEITEEIEVIMLSAEALQ